jgi:DNA-binding MarR family transcriptional regulator
MDLTDILDELDRSGDRVPDARWLRALGGALGVELSRRRLEQLVPVLRSLGRSAARASAASASFESGYAAALQDVVLAFQAELGAEVEDSEVSRLIAQSPYAEALSALANGNQTVTAIGIAMGKTKSSASRALAVLREAGLVTAYATPSSGVADDRARPHALTVRGRRAVEQMQQQRARAARRRATPIRGARVAGAFASGKKSR